MADFRGASADGVADLADELRQQVSGATRRAATMADDLFTVSRSLRQEGGLRRFLTDASLPAQARTGLVGEVFGSQVDDQSLTLLSSAVSKRWTSAGDLPRGLEHLSVIAAVRSAGNEGERLSDELFTVSESVKNNHALRDALSDPGRSTEDKSALVRDLLGDRTLEATRTLTVQAIAGTYRTVGVALNEYQKVAADVQQEGVATVHSARPLSEDEQHRLAAALQRQYDRPIHLNTVVDEDVLGGIRVAIGHDVIDGTVASRLAEARRTLAGSGR